MAKESSKTRRDPKAKFIELANKRVNKAIKDIRLVGNLSNKSTYSYDEAQAKKIIRVLQKELDAVKGKFGGGDSEDESVFRL
jgi:ABC-type Fe3+-hydroxamate transport system substrate-binding protein